MTRPKPKPQSAEADNENRARGRGDASKESSQHWARHGPRAYASDVGGDGNVRTRTLSPPQHQSHLKPLQPLQQLEVASVLHLPEHMRMTFIDDNASKDTGLDSRVEAMRLATKQAAIREEAARHMLGQAAIPMAQRSMWAGSSPVFESAGQQGRTQSPSQLGSATTQWQSPPYSRAVSPPTRAVSPGIETPPNTLSPSPSGFLATPALASGAAATCPTLQAHLATCLTQDSSSVGQDDTSPSFLEDVSVPSWAWGASSPPSSPRKMQRHPPHPGSMPITAHGVYGTVQCAPGQLLSRSLVAPSAPSMMQQASHISPSKSRRDYSPASWRVAKKTSSIASHALSAKQGSTSTNGTLAKSGSQKVLDTNGDTDGMREELKKLTKEIHAARIVVQQAQYDLTQKVEGFSLDQVETVEDDMKIAKQKISDLEAKMESRSRASTASIGLSSEAQQTQSRSQTPRVGSTTSPPLTSTDDESVELPELGDTIDNTLNADSFLDDASKGTSEEDGRKPYSLPGSISTSSTITTDLRKATVVRASQVDWKRGLTTPRAGPLATSQCGASVASTIGQPPPSASRLQRTATVPAPGLIQPVASQVRTASVRRVSPVRQDNTPVRSSSKTTANGKTPTGTPVLAKRPTARLSPVQLRTSITQPTTGVKAVASSPVLLRSSSPAAKRSTSPGQPPPATQVGNVESPQGGSVRIQLGTAKSAAVRVQAPTPTHSQTGGSINAPPGSGSLVVKAAGSAHTPVGGATMRVMSPAPCQGSDLQLPIGGSVLVRSRAASPGSTTVVRAVSPVVRAVSPGSQAHPVAVKASHLSPMSPRGYKVAAASPQLGAGGRLMPSLMVTGNSQNPLPNWCMVPQAVESPRKCVKVNA